MKTEFIHLVTREIRTPLSTVVGFSQVLADFSIEITEEEFRTMIHCIVRDAWCVSQMIDRMLDMSEVLGLQTLACNSMSSARVRASAWLSPAMPPVCWVVTCGSIRPTGTGRDL